MSIHHTMNKYRLVLCAIGIALFASQTPVGGHDQIPGEPQKRPIALVGGTVHRVDHPSIDGGTVLFEEGKITAVGKNVQLPGNCQSIDVSGKHVYPGLMESMSNMGMVEVLTVRGSVDTREIGSENANLRPWVAVNPDSELIPVARAGGVLLASIAADSGSIKSQTAVIQLDGWTPREMLVEGDAGVLVQWRDYDSRESDDRKRASQRDKRLSELRERLDEARRYAEARKNHPEETPTDIRLEALARLANGETPMIIDADRRREIESAVAFCVSEGIRPVIYGGYDAPLCASLLKQHDVPVIVHATYRLPMRRDDPYDHPYTLPRRLAEAKVRFAIGGEGTSGPGGASQAMNLPYHAAVAVAYGLDPQQAIRAVTLSPAEIMGVDDRVGSLTVGKYATLIVCDGDILLTKTKVTDAYVGGAKVDLGNKHKTLAEKYRIKYRRSP